MTETLQRPAASSGPGVVALRRRPLVVGALAALVAVVLGVLLVALPVVAVWAADGRTTASLADCLRTAGQVWLAAHGAALDVPGGRFSLTPLGLSLLPLALLMRAGRAVSQERAAAGVRAAGRAAATVAVPYAGLCGVVAAGSATAGLEPSVASAVLGGLVLALVGACAGALRPHGLWRAAWLRRGARTRRTLPAAGVAISTLAAGGALLAGGSLAFHGGRATEVAAAVAPGVVGGAGLLLVGLAYVPNAVVWAMSWLAGPGFGFGTGTHVGPFTHELGAVPALPLLAALPAAGIPGWAGSLAVLVPVAAGALAGRRLHGCTDELSRTGAALDVLVTSAWAGSASAVLVLLSAGSAGGGRLERIGPSVAHVGLAVASEVAVGALTALVVLRRRTH